MVGGPVEPSGTTELNDLIREAISRGDDECWVLDGNVTGIISVPNPPPLRAVNRWGVIHVDRFRSDVPGAVIDGLYFKSVVGDTRLSPTASPLNSNVVVHLTQPRMVVENCKVDGFGWDAYEEGIKVTSRACSDGPATVLNNRIEEWGAQAPFTNTAVSVAIRVGTEATDDIGRFGEGYYGAHIIGNTITAQKDIDTPSTVNVIPIQTYWNSLIAGNIITAWNCGSDEGGVQVKTSGCLVSYNTFDNDAGVNAGNGAALYDRLPKEDGNVWENNYVTNLDLGINHFGASNTTYENNVIANCNDGMLIKLTQGAYHGLQVKNNTFFWAEGGGGRIIYWDNNFDFTGSGFDITHNIFDKGGTASTVTVPEELGRTPYGLYTLDYNIHTNNARHPDGGRALSSPGTWHPAADNTSWTDDGDQQTPTGPMKPVTGTGDISLGTDPLYNPANWDFTRVNNAVSGGEGSDPIGAPANFGASSSPYIRYTRR